MTKRKLWKCALAGALMALLSWAVAHAQPAAEPEDGDEQLQAMIELVTNIHRCLSGGGDVYITLDPTPNEANRARFECRPRRSEQKG